LPNQWPLSKRVGSRTRYMAARNPARGGYRRQHDRQRQPIPHNERRLRAATLGAHSATTGLQVALSAIRGAPFLARSHAFPQVINHSPRMPLPFASCLHEPAVSHRDVRCVVYSIKCAVLRIGSRADDQRRGLDDNEVLRRDVECHIHPIHVDRSHQRHLPM
jgi:hypothetical protein